MSVEAIPSAPEQRFRVSLVSWDKYEQMAAWFAGRHVRLTYDRGELELMTVSHKHEYHKHLLALLLMALFEELDLDVHGGGSMTFKREDLDRGLEPDECYWIQNELRMRGKQDYDQQNEASAASAPLTIASRSEAPPPDLVLEVEISRSVLDRMGIDAAMKVPEVWRWDGEQLLFCLLQRGNCSAPRRPATRTHRAWHRPRKWLGA